jgi:hypothetical protein
MRTQYSEHERDHYITIEQIGWIRKIIARETVQLDPNDANSTRIWAERLQSAGHFIYITRTSEISRLRDRISRAMHSFFASRPNSNWNCSGASAMRSWESMRRITSRNTKEYFYLQLWHGITGATVRASRLSKGLW